MASYNGNYLNMLNGHMNLYDPSGEPSVPKVSTGMTDDTVANVRQALTNVVGRGYKNVNDADAKHDYASLVTSVGIKQARKLMDQAIIHNQRADVRNMGLDTKVQSFFDMGSSDPETNTLIKKAKSFGDGVVAGMNRSPDVGNLKMANRYDALPETDKNDQLLVDANKILK